MMKKHLLTVTSLLLAASCDRAPAYDSAMHAPSVEALQQGLIGPAGREVAADPCRESPDNDALCGYLVSARRISWFGYLSRWMRVLHHFGVQRQNPGSYARLAADDQNFGVGHPDRFLGPAEEPFGGGPKSSYVALKELFGEPMDDLGTEDTPILSYRQQYKLQTTAAVTKQACRISAAQASRLASRLRGQYEQTRLDLIANLIEADISNNTISVIRGFKPAFGYLAYGRKLEQRELDTLNGALGTDGARAGDNFAGFRTALTALMCSTPALVE